MTPETAPQESPNQRLARIELDLAEDPAARPTREDADFMLKCLRQLGDQRVLGLREAASLIRGAADKEVTARFLVGKREHAARAMNNKLMHTVSNLIEGYADAVRDGRVA